MMRHLQVSDCKSCPSSPNCGAAGFRPIADAFRQLRDYIGSVGPGRQALCLSDGTPSDYALRKAAARLADARKARSRFLPADFLGEAAWDILLELFAHHLPLSVKSVGIGSGVPATTTLRWIGLLEQEGLLAQYPDPADARRTLVKLTDAGTQAVAAAINGIREAMLDMGDAL